MLSKINLACVGALMRQVGVGRVAARPALQGRPVINFRRKEMS
jgi:hypothetical protein